MYRRGYLAGATAGIGAAVAGCLGDDSGLDQAEVQVIDAWFQDSVDLIDEGYIRVTSWFEQPESADLAAMDSLASTAETLSTRWTEAVEPKLDGLENTEINRTVADETWLVEGGEFATVLADLQWGVDAVRTGVGALVAAEGDPDRLAEADLTTLEELADDGRTTTDAAVELWFQDTLEE